jgi:DNA invertase Pin-like site-specific DNA recombinase
MRAYSYVRFSTPEQEKDHSLRRQVEQSEAYCQAHGLTLDDSLRLTDRGLSAFHGVHRAKGALGEFHRLVEGGEVEPGSVLLVESLDRLSWEQVLDALTQFTSLIPSRGKSRDPGRSHGIR